MITFPELETQRLVLRELTLKDCQAVYEHFADIRVTQFMDIAPCKDVLEAADIIQFHLDDTGCRYGLFHKDSRRLAGTCGYHCWTQDGESKAEIGFDLSHPYWGLGLMQEALEEMIRFGFQAMKLDYIEATVDPGNVRSQRLLEKMNFRRHPEQRDNLIYYTLNKDYLTESKCSVEQS